VSICEVRFPEVRSPALVVIGSKDPDFPTPTDEAALIAGRLRGRSRRRPGRPLPGSVAPDGRW
jgi:hypothetical protein